MIDRKIGFSLDVETAASSRVTLKRLPSDDVYQPLITQATWVEFLVSILQWMVECTCHLGDIDTAASANDIHNKTKQSSHSAILVEACRIDLCKAMAGEKVKPIISVALTLTASVSRPSTGLDVF